MSHQLLIGAFGIIVCSSLSQLATVAKTPQPQPVPTQQETKFVVETGDHLIHDLIKRCGEFLGRTYLVDKSQNPAICNPDSAVGKIHIPKRLELDAKACEDVMSQMLATRGWIACPLDTDRGVWDWVYIQGPRSIDLKKHVTALTPDEALKRPKLAQYVSTVMSLEHVNALTRFTRQ